MTAFRFVLVIALVALTARSQQNFLLRSPRLNLSLCRPLLARLRVGRQRNSYHPSLMRAMKTPFGWVRRSCGPSFPNARSGNGRRTSQGTSWKSSL